MPANLENSAVTTGLEKVNPKKGQCQRLFKLLHNCIHFTCQQDHAQNPSSQASTVCELRTSRCSSWIQKRQRNQRSNRQHLLDHGRSKRISEKIYFCSLTTLKPLRGSQRTVENSPRDGTTGPSYLPPEKSVCRSRSNRTGHGTTEWFQIGKGVRQGCILPVYRLSLFVFNFYAEYIMQNTGLDETQAGIKITGRNTNNLRYADDTTLMAESREELRAS